MFNFGNLVKRGKITKKINAKDYITVQKPDASGNFTESAISAEDLKLEVAKSITHTAPGAVAPSYLEVDISSAQILAMGVTPIELLPLPGAGTYYEYAGYAEYTNNGIAYTLALDDVVFIASGTNFTGTFVQGLFLKQTNNNIAKFGGHPPQYNLGQDPLNADVVSQFFGENESIKMGMWSGTNPTLGNGTIKAKIWYTVRTFG